MTKKTEYLYLSDYTTNNFLTANLLFIMGCPTLTVNYSHFLNVAKVTKLFMELWIILKCY